MYIADLIERVKSKEWLPESGPVLRNEDSVSYQAYREMEKLSDLSHLEELRGLVKKAKRNQDVQALARVIWCLYTNTGSKEVRDLYPDLCRKEKLGSYCVMYLIEYATKAKFVEILPFVRKWLEWHTRVDDHYREALYFLAMALGKDATHELGSHLDHDCFGRADPFFCIEALEGVNDPEALPYFKRFIERHEKGRKRWEFDGVRFSLKAIDNLSKQTEPATARNGGPAERLGSSGASGEPPSVS